MLLLILIGVACLLLGGFLVLTAYERKHARVFHGVRTKLDRVIGRALFIARHVDWSAFSKHMVRTGIERALHDIAHGILRIVRFLERSLTRAVRLLRERRAGIMTTRPHGVERKSLKDTVREFRKSLVRRERQNGE